MDHTTAVQVPTWVSRLDPKTIVAIVALLLGGAASYFTMSARVDELSRQIQILQQNEVPRQESAVRDNAIQEQLKDIKLDLHDIKARLLDLQK